MFRYKCTFIGCKKGAIGIHYQIVAFVEAPSREAARIKLYDDYDHVSQLHCEAVSCDTPWKDKVLIVAKRMRLGKVPLPDHALLSLESDLELVESVKAAGGTAKQAIEAMGRRR